MLKNGGQKISRTQLTQNLNDNIKKASDLSTLSIETLEAFIFDPFQNKPTVKEAIVLSQKFGCSTIS